MITILGAGAFGAALACVFGREAPVQLWGRGLEKGMKAAPRLPNHLLPTNVCIAGTPAEAVKGAEVILLAVPMGALQETLGEYDDAGVPQIACCKGIDPLSGKGPVSTMATRSSEAPLGVLTGPSFARDIAAGLPTALTLAMGDRKKLNQVQELLSRPTLRIYRTTDTTGAEMGGALKNVLAIAAGAVMGAELGQSAQAALITRGFAEIRSIAAAEGAVPSTLLGLSGMGDLVLTAFSEGSRNYRYGLALGAGQQWKEDTTVEGISTAKAVIALADRHNIQAPVLSATHSLISGALDIGSAVKALMSRPLKEEV